MKKLLLALLLSIVPFALQGMESQSFGEFSEEGLESLTAEDREICPGPSNSCVDLLELSVEDQESLKSEMNEVQRKQGTPKDLFKGVIEAIGPMPID